MKLTATGALFAFLLSATAAHAELYKWVGPDGKITYSDAPPPKSARNVEQKNLEVGESDTGNLPYEVARAAKNNPVTLYTSAKCIPCDDGREFLNKRGIPFKEKTVSSNDDIARLRQSTGDSQLPALLIGKSKQTGFESNAWGAALTAAGYPQTSQLPKTYRNAPAEAAAPVAKAAHENGKAAAENRSAAPAESLPAPAGNAPPGFRF